MTEPNAANPRTNHGFLPDLCAPPALLLLVLVAELLALLLAAVDRGLAQLSWDAVALYSFQIQWITLVSALLLCRLRSRLNRWAPVRAAATSYGLILAVTGVFALLAQWLMPAVVGGEPELAFWPVAEQLFIAAIVAGIGLRYFYLQHQLHQRRQAELDARIQALQSRIRPHFLFNSLNSIASLIGSDPARAERAVEDLGGLFRASLSEPALIPVERELALCRGYLAMEQLRLGERLRVHWQVDELPTSARLPALLLQPLLENAVFHGIEPCPDGGEIDIRVAATEGQLSVRIDNPLPARGAGERSGREHNRMALDNVRHRLQAHFGRAARLSEQRTEARFTLTITCPME